MQWKIYAVMSLQGHRTFHIYRSKNIKVTQYEKKKKIYFVLGVCINIDFFPLYPIFPAEIRNIYGSPLVPYTANISLPRVIYRPRE